MYPPNYQLTFIYLFSMRQSIKTWMTFGITSWIITTLWLMVGLASWTWSLMVVIGWILTIAVADSFSDALGIHLSQESDKKNSKRSIWTSTLTAFLSKFIFALTFLIPIFIFSLKTGIIINIIRWLFALVVLSYRIAKTNKEDIRHAIIEHVSIAVIVIVATYYIWVGIARFFG